jgi:signal transduction histidine kinase
MLNRLGIRQKLTLLLMIPLTAVVVVLVPFTSERIGEARSAGATARIALAARGVGGLIEALQQERLLSLGYLAVRTLDRSALVAETQSAADQEGRLRSDPLTADLMAPAADPLDALVAVREKVIARTIDAKTVYTAFRNANAALLDALRLINPPGADAQGLAQLGALDELMRSNEEASSVGTLVVAATIDGSLGREPLTNAVTADQLHLQRFRQLVPPDEYQLVDTVDSGRAGQRLRQLVSAVTTNPPSPTAPASSRQVSDALTAADSYIDLRRFAQDRFAREVASGAESRAGTATVTAYVVASLALVILLLVAGLGFAVSRSIARPLRRLTRAATFVAELSASELTRVADTDAHDAPAPSLAAVEVDSADEIGELAIALNRVQSTASQLLERQVSARRNVSVMFANIARRTQNLVGRQLTLIDDLERNEQSPELLQRLYRLDHVATRLRRSADSLLVVSGTIDQMVSGGPTLLADVIRAALTEIEAYQSIDIAEVAEVAVTAGLAGDLRLLLAELLDNATNFSPPGSRVSVSATVESDCRIVITDHGLGISQARLDEENSRLLERERLDVAPTTVLGLFVVGRLARRHGLAVRLDHSDTRGITATVRIPERLLAPANAVGRGAGTLVARVRPKPSSTRRVVFDAIEVEPGDSFPWFVPPRELAAGPGRGPESSWPGGWENSDTSNSWTAAPADTWTDAPANTRTAAPANTWTAAPANTWTDARGNPWSDTGPSSWTATGAAAYGEQPAPPTAPQPQQTAAGLARRIPGTHMVADQPGSAVKPAARPRRDPEAERDLLNEYMSGHAKASGDQDQAESSRSTFAERHS